MKITHLTSVHPASDTRIFHKMARTLAAAGHEVVLVAVAESDATVEAVRIRAVAIAHGRLGRMTKTVWRVLRHALTEQADIYHFHDPELIPAGLWLKLCGKRVVYDVHEDLPAQILSKPWIRPGLRRVVARVMAGIEAFGARWFDGIVVANPPTVQRFPPAKTVLVRNFPLLAEFDELQGEPYDRRPPLLAYVGNITRVRGVCEMLEALARVPESLGVRLALVGPFNEPKFEAASRAMPGWQRVDFLGWQDRAGVVRLLARARVGLVTLHPIVNYQAAYPVKMFEYMAAGLPVVASNIPLWREIVEGCDCGLIVDPHDPEAIAAAVRWLLEHPEEAEAMGRRGRQAVHERYNWEEEWQILLALYKRFGR
jgi:glycosyltransferase involved in cell wall biosynthesis